MRAMRTNDLPRGISGDVSSRKRRIQIHLFADKMTKHIVPAVCPAKMRGDQDQPGKPVKDADDGLRVRMDPPRATPDRCRHG